MGRLHKLNQQAEIAIRLHLDRLHLDMNVHRGEIGSNDSEKGDVNNIIIHMHIEYQLHFLHFGIILLQNYLFIK